MRPGLVKWEESGGGARGGVGSLMPSQTVSKAAQLVFNDHSKKRLASDRQGSRAEGFGSKAVLAIDSAHGRGTESDVTLQPQQPTLLAESSQREDYNFIGISGKSEGLLSDKKNDLLGSRCRKDFPSTPSQNTPSWRPNLVLNYQSPKARKPKWKHTDSVKWKPYSCTNSKKNFLVIDTQGPSAEQQAFDRQSDPGIIQTLSSKSAHQKNRVFKFDPDSLTRVKCLRRENKQIVSCTNANATWQSATPLNLFTDLKAANAFGRKQAPIDVRQNFRTPKSTSCWKPKHGGDFKIDKGSFAGKSNHLPPAKSLEPLNIRCEGSDSPELVLTGGAAELMLDGPEKFALKTASRMNAEIGIARKPKVANFPSKKAPESKTDFLFKKKPKKEHVLVGAGSFKLKPTLNSAAVFLSSDYNTLPAVSRQNFEDAEPVEEDSKPHEKERLLQEKLARVTREMKIKSDSYNRMLEAKEETILRLESEKEALLTDKRKLINQLETQMFIAEQCTRRLQQKDPEFDLSQLLKCEKQPISDESDLHVKLSTEGPSQLKESEFYRMEDSPERKQISASKDRPLTSKLIGTASFPPVLRPGMTPKMSMMQGKMVTLYSATPHPGTALPNSLPISKRPPQQSLTQHLTVDIEESDDSHTATTNRLETNPTHDTRPTNAAKQRTLDTKESQGFNSAKKALFDPEIAKNDAYKQFDKQKQQKSKTAVYTPNTGLKSKIQGSTKPVKLTKPGKHLPFSESFAGAKETQMTRSDLDSKPNLDSKQTEDRYSQYVTKPKVGSFCGTTPTPTLKSATSSFAHNVLSVCSSGKPTVRRPRSQWALERRQKLRSQRRESASDRKLRTLQQGEHAPSRRPSAPAPPTPGT